MVTEPKVTLRGRMKNLIIIFRNMNYSRDDVKDNKYKIKRKEFS